MNRPGEGATAMSRCTSLKEDHIKGTTSMSINMRLEDQIGEVLGSGNNLTLNNLNPEMLEKLKKILGAPTISDAIPICVQISVMVKKAEVDFWKMKFEEEEKELPKEQSKLEGAPQPPEKKAEVPVEKAPKKSKGSKAIEEMCNPSPEVVKAQMKAEQDRISKIADENLAKEKAKATA